MHIFPTLFKSFVTSCLTDPYLLNNHSIVTRLLAGATEESGTRNFSVFQSTEIGSGVQPASYSTGNGGSVPGGGVVKRTTRVHVVPRLRSSGSITQLPSIP